MKLDNAFYHLIVFLACIASLTAIILTGHDDSPLLRQMGAAVFGGVLGGSGSGALPLLARFLKGPGGPTPPPAVESGFVRLPLVLAICLASIGALLCVSCASIGQAAKSDPIALSCASASVAIKSLTAAQQAGQLTVTEAVHVSQALAVVDPICEAPSEPNASGAVLTALASSVAQLQGYAAQHATAH